MNQLQKKVLEHIDEELLIDIAKDMISIPSISGEEGKLAEFLVKRIGKLGFKAELQEVPGYKGRPNVIGILEGDKDYRSLMFNGHIDQVPPAPDWTRDPFKPEVINRRLYGHQHMKAGDTAMIMAAYAIKEAGIKPRGDIILTLVMGECDTFGLGTIEACKRYKADAGICGEPAGAHYILITQVGVTQFQITVEGRLAHQSQPQIQLNAIRKMCKIISKLDASILTYKKHKLLEDPSLVIGKISGGLHPAFTAPSCTIHVDVRTVPGMAVESVKKDVENLIEKLRKEDPELKATVDMLEPPKFYPRPPLEVSQDEPIVQSIRRAHKYVTGEEPGIGADVWESRGVTDAIWMINAGIPTPIYGPTCPEYLCQLPNADVYMEVDDIVTVSKVMALAALDFCTQKK